MFNPKAGKILINFYFAFILVCLPAMLCFSMEMEEGNSLNNLESEDEMINPHFTGKDCDICHESIPKFGQKEIHLKFKGNDIDMCNSCHNSEYAKGDIHPAGISPPEGDSIHIPPELPLYEGKITCRTCHDVYKQCKINSSEQFENMFFLRGAPYKKKTDICFLCHKKDYFIKINPHKQINENGEIMQEKCLYCHQSLPDPESVTDMQEVVFKTGPSELCTSCHSVEESCHPAKANHMISLSDDNRTVIKESEIKYNVIFPLLENKKIFCGTCHNPHEKGVIKLEKAAKGSDEEYRLRLDWSYDLCVACHKNKEDLFSRVINIDLPEKELSSPPMDEGVPSYHKSFIEKKCRACHKITRESPERPVVFKMCFQVDCHNASLVGKAFKHSDARKGNCLICHNAHGSQYGGHILNDQDKLCKSCHPLLGKREKSPGDKTEEDFHDYYVALMKKLVPDWKITCSSCHGEDHSGKIPETGIIPCFACHNFIKKLIEGKKFKPEDVHDNCKDKICCECHDPHSSPYQFILKDKPETYKMN
jgi:predicted CXXCH cytochrome family protein